MIRATTSSRRARSATSSASAGKRSAGRAALLSDADVLARLPELHVFGRVTPEDKLRITRLLQARGEVVAMRADAVNDAAALKQADIGVAMGSGSEVTKQAAKMVLTDDNFGTLVEAIRLGRTIYDKIVSYIRYQMSGLFSLVSVRCLQCLRHQQRVPLTPLMVIYVSFFVTFFPSSSSRSIRARGHHAAAAARRPAGAREPSLDLPVGALRRDDLRGGAHGASGLSPAARARRRRVCRSQTAFVVLCIGPTLAGLAMRRDPASGLVAPIGNALKWLWIPIALTVVSVETGVMHQLLMTRVLMPRSGGSRSVSPSSRRSSSRRTRRCVARLTPAR